MGHIGWFESSGFAFGVRLVRRVALHGEVGAAQFCLTLRVQVPNNIQ